MKHRCVLYNCLSFQLYVSYVTLGRIRISADYKRLQNNACADQWEIRTSPVWWRADTVRHFVL